MTRRLPAEVDRVFRRLPEAQKAELLVVRDLIFEVAAERRVGRVTETLKWGEPAYLTQVSKAGSTIRLGITKSTPGRCAVFFSCNTTLIAEFRTRFSDSFSFDGNRALILPSDGSWSRIGLAMCLGEALTYHRRKLHNRPAT
ncbi:MAG TPA: DUF1801 domain-containing protein [Devosia sp.]|jgi:hypothetical protein|uniref:DUF1801 domain-containing protein n=1 Tax=Devosia sp. TaxID=1871048 RepID=UPI002F94A5F6